MAQELVTGGRERRLQKRAQRGDGWTAERRATFLDHLAATCNVTRATRAAGMGNNSVYALRQRDETFAAQWRAALSAGYERLAYNDNAASAGCVKRVSRRFNLAEYWNQKGDIDQATTTVWRANASS